VTRFSMPTILVTGASGFIGKNFLVTIKPYFKIFALSRRLPLEKEFLEHPNITWIQADICSPEAMQRAKAIMEKEGGIHFVYHLAGYYDFNYDLNPEYYRTNVEGTENVLALSKEMNIKRFIFASSIAACEFPKPGEVIHENSPANANFEYARTKKLGEGLVETYSEHFPCSIVRFGAAFSDWCEYGPMFHFLKTWTTKSWKSHMLGGRGQSAITYIHINCLNELILKIIRKTSELGQFDRYVASPNNPVTHQELFLISTLYFFGKSKRAIYIPKILATLGVYVMDILGKIIGKRPFERPWMMQYIDKQLRVDASYTRKVLDWNPTKRYRIQRRLLYMIEHMKSYPYEWQKRNLKASKALTLNPNFKIYQALEDDRAHLIEEILQTFKDPKNKGRFPTYQAMDSEILRKDIMAVYQFLSVSVRSKDRVSALAYSRQTANLRYKEGFPVQEVMDAFRTTGDVILRNLNDNHDLHVMEMDLHNEISLTFQIMIDEIEGTYESLDWHDKPSDYFKLEHEETT